MITVIIGFMTELWFCSPEAHIWQPSQFSLMFWAPGRSPPKYWADANKDKHTNTRVCLPLCLCNTQSELHIRHATKLVISCIKKNGHTVWHKLENDIWKMGTTVEIRDIKIINQCLEMQGCACVGVGLSFVFLPLSVLICFCCISPFSVLLCAFFCLSQEVANGQSLEVSRWDVFFVFF